MNARLLHLGTLSAMLWLGCSAESPPNDRMVMANNSPAAQPGCQPLSVSACPCPGSAPGTMGTQQCAATGDSYGACTGCPPATPASVGPNPGSSTPGSDAGAMPASPNAGNGTAGMSPGATPGADAGAGAGQPDPSTMPNEDNTVRLGLASEGAAEGVSCGVGLPLLCELGSEKCCTRSLRTDTCIGMSESCSCELPNCATMEALCDGPEDCPEGQQCCGTLSGGSSYTRFECATSCDYRNTQRIACHQDAPECPSGTECANSQLLTNVQVCIDPATIRQ